MEGGEYAALLIRRYTTMSNYTRPTANVTFELFNTPVTQIT